MKIWGFKHKQTYVWVKTKKKPFQDLKRSLFKGATGALNLINLISDSSTQEIKREIKSFSHAIASRTRLIKMADILAFGMGRLFRQTHEICLVGISSNQVYKKLQNKSQRSVSFGENLKHSAKPETLQDSLEIMFPGSRKLEMFARRSRKGWTCLGNEIDGKDIRDALAALK